MKKFSIALALAVLVSGESAVAQVARTPQITPLSGPIFSAGGSGIYRDKNGKVCTGYAAYMAGYPSDREALVDCNIFCETFKGIYTDCILTKNVPAPWQYACFACSY